MGVPDEALEEAPNWEKEGVVDEERVDAWP